MKSQGSVLISIVKLILVVAILGGTILYAKHLMDTRPQAELRPPSRSGRLVETVAAEASDRQAVIAAMGTVIPVRKVTLTPEVTGLLAMLSEAVIPGGLVAAGEELARIDTRDYEILLNQRETEVVRAQAAVQQEEGSQAVARREYELLGETLDGRREALILRKPQLATVEAALAAAVQARDKARLDLARCVIRAPFGGVISEKLVEVGARVAPGTGLVTLTGDDEYWVEAVVPVEQLRWIEIPTENGHPGSRVQIYDEAAWGAGRSREGRVIRLLSELEKQGRMARLLIAVNDPLALAEPGAPRLLLGALVRLEIMGVTMKNIIAVQRAHIREGDQVWVMLPERKLQTRTVDYAYKANNEVFVNSGLRPGDLIITTPIAAPVEGMQVRLATDPVVDDGANGGGPGAGPPGAGPPGAGQSGQERKPGQPGQPGPAGPRQS